MLWGRSGEGRDLVEAGRHRSLGAIWRKAIREIEHQKTYTAGCQLVPYPLTAPTVKPAMNRSTKKLYTMAMGTLAMKQAAINEPQK